MLNANAHSANPQDPLDQSPFFLPVQTGSHANDNELAGSDPFWPNRVAKTRRYLAPGQHSSPPCATSVALTSILLLKIKDHMWRCRTSSPTAVGLQRNKLFRLPSGSIKCSVIIHNDWRCSYWSLGSCLSVTAAITQGHLSLNLNELMFWLHRGSRNNTDMLSPFFYYSFNYVSGSTNYWAGYLTLRLLNSPSCSPASL